jgi:carbon-monoxide dehydrogenase medium subunit
MTPFELAEPDSLAEALTLLDPDDPTVRPIAGGTALMLMLKAAVFRPSRLVSLRRIEPRHGEIVGEQDGTLRIGAMTTLAALERSPVVHARVPVVTRTLRTLSNIRVRNVATVGGALAHGDPHMDLPPVLIALGASVLVAQPGGAERTLKVEDLLAGYYETVLARNELIAELRIPPQGARRAAYVKITTGSADDWPAVGVAVALEVDGSTVRAATLALGAATAKASRLAGAEAALAGSRADDAGLARVADAALAGTEILSDLRGSAPYKRELLRVAVKRAVRQALSENGGAR